MAEQETVDKKKVAEQAVPEGKGPKMKVLSWLVVPAVIVLCAVPGFFVGRLFGTRGQAGTASAGQAPPVDTSPKIPDREIGWFYELDPVVANLNEPGATRYARLTLTLEINPTWRQEQAKPILDQKKPLMKHWLTLYMANQTIEDTQGERNLLRMQSHISDLFNQGMFPNVSPRIKSVLFKEFAIQ
jgi:flagellar basal body-associated protein FliL